MGRERQYEGVRPASASSIEIDFYYSGTRCKERLKLQPTPANIKRAAQHRAAILSSIERGEFDYATTFPNSKNARKFAKVPEAVGLTMTSYLDTWLDSQKKKLKASTWDDYRKIVNNTLIPSLGKIELVSFKRSDAKSLVKGMTCSNKRIANILSVLRIALTEAVEDELIDSNPISDWGYQNSEAPKKVSDVDPFTKEEQSLILAKCEYQFKNLVKFALWTGLRTSELCALDWSDIDWVRGTVHINKALTYCADEVEDPKTPSSIRDVKILAPALEALKAQKAYTFIKGQEVFQDDRTGKRWTGDQAIRQGPWHRSMRLAGVRYRRPYQTRHTYASMMLSAGEHPMWVARQMGHSSWTMISKTYGKWMPDAAPDAGSKAQAIYGNVDQNVDQVSQNRPIPPQSIGT